MVTWFSPLETKAIEPSFDALIGVPSVAIIFIPWLPLVSYENGAEISPSIGFRNGLLVVCFSLERVCSSEESTALLASFASSEGSVDF